MDFVSSTLASSQPTDTSRLDALDPSKKPDSPAKAREAAEAFEAFFIETMLKEMRKTVPKVDQGQGQAMALFEGLFDQAIGESISKGRGIGLADMLEKNLLQGMDLGAEGCLGHGQADCSFEAGIDGLVDLGRISSSYGLRKDPISGKYKNHGGLDIAMPEGTPVHTIAPGRVTFSGQKSGYGEVVIVDHGDGLQSLYAHLRNRDVKVGDFLDDKDSLGWSGQSGRATGPHLHLEVRENGESINPEHFQHVSGK